MKVFLRREAPASCCYQSTGEVPSAPREGMFVTFILSNGITLQEPAPLWETSGTMLN